MSPERKSYLYAITTVLLWSTVATAFKLSLRELDLLQLIFIIAAVTVIILFGFLVAQKKLGLLFAQTKKEYLFSMALGVFNPALYYIVLFNAYSLLPAQLAQPLNMVWPIVLTLLSVFFLGQKIKWLNFLAMGVSFAGVVFVSSQGSFSGFRNTNPVGVGFALLAALMWSLYWIMNVRDRRDEIVKLFTGFFFGMIFLAIAVTLFSDFRFPKGISLTAAIYTGIFETGISYVFWMNAMKLSSNNARIANLIFLTPFISLIFIRLVLKEEIFITTFIGLIFIVSGILIQQLKKKATH
jgi:drug/metabolite transporter (DMT)-like permease